MANGYAHQAGESIPGNEDNSPTPSTKVIYPPLQSLEINPNPRHLERDDEARNSDEALQVLPEAFDPTWRLTSRAYPDLMGFELKNILGAPTSTAGDGIITDPDTSTIPVGATRHVWTAPFGPSGASPLTKQIQAAWRDNNAFFAKLKGAATSELSIATPESGGAILNSSGPGLYVAKIADPSLTPAFESLAIAPFMRSHLTIDTWLSGTARTEDFTVQIANPVEAVRTLGISSMFPDVMEKGDGPIIVSGSIPKRSIDPDDWDALMAATRFAVKVKWQSTVSIGATAYKYTLWLECDGAQYVGGGPNALTNSRRIGANFNWKATSDGAGASSTWTLVNATTSYA